METKEGGPFLLVALSVVAIVLVFMTAPAVFHLGIQSYHDIAGQGTHSTTSGGACETQSVLSRSYSPQPVSEPAFSAAFFVETDTLLLSEHSGGCSGPVTSTSTTTAFYPVTPAMVYSACYPGYSDCTAYPQFIIQYYQTAYPSILGGSASVVPQSSMNIVTPETVVTWEALGY